MYRPDPQSEFVARIKALTDHGIAMPAEYEALRRRLNDFLALEHPLRDRLIDTVVNDAPTKNTGLSQLFALAVAEASDARQAGPVRQAVVNAPTSGSQPSTPTPQQTSTSRSQTNSTTPQPNSRNTPHSSTSKPKPPKRSNCPKTSAKHGSPVNRQPTNSPNSYPCCEPPSSWLPVCVSTAIQHGSP